MGPPTDNLAASFTHTREYDEYTKLLRGPTSLNEIPFDIQYMYILNGEKFVYADN